MPPAIYVDDDKALSQLVQRLRQESLIALDTESNSMHAYTARVCLIQLSIRDQDYIIDPLAIDDLRPLGEVLAEPKIETVLHAAEYDLICLRRDYDFEVRGIFDTMLAARVLNQQNIGLADLLHEYFGVEVDKRHQLDDWGKRPLPEDSLHYAQMDTHFLPFLRDQLHTQLKALGRLDEAAEVFEDLSRIDVRSNGFDPEGYWKLGRPSSLSRREMAYLRELYLIREEVARAEDVPPYKVMSNKTLVRLARRQPDHHGQLYDQRDVPSHVVRRYGQEILDALERGRTGPLPQPPRSSRPDPVIADRYSTLHAWRKERAIQRNVESNIVLSKQTLWELAHKMPTTRADLADIEGMGEWRLNQYGDEILHLIHDMLNGKR